MSANKVNSNDYQSLASSSKKNGAINGDISTLKPLSKNRPTTEEQEVNSLTGLVNPFQKIEQPAPELPTILQVKPIETVVSKAVSQVVKTEKVAENPKTFADEQKQRKLKKALEKDEKLLNSDRWITRNGHSLTYVGIFLFSLVVYFRPYEWIPGFESFTSIAMILAIATLLIYLPTQLSTEGNVTILTTEVKCVLFLIFWSLLTMPIAKDPTLAWTTFNETFSKIMLMFIVMVNTLRTKERLKGLMWLSLGIGVMLSWEALRLYQEGKFAVEDYRVGVDFGGMFGNPNDLALHLVMFTPIAIALGLISKNTLGKLVYFGAATIMVMANFVTQSRGGFLGLIAISIALVWKFGKKNRVLVFGIAIVVGILVISLAPGNYWMRILSIFNPALDAVGSSNQRQELLERSIQVTLRNPLGIGLGNFPVVGVHNLQTHNAFTQVSSELGWFGLVAYLILLISPLRKLAALERQMFSKSDSSWIYYLAIGIQISIIGYMVSSFFVSVAYQWFVYYPIAYAVCLRRIYNIQQQEKGEPIIDESSLTKYFKLQKT